MDEVQVIASLFQKTKDAQNKLLHIQVGYNYDYVEIGRSFRRSKVPIAGYFNPNPLYKPELPPKGDEIPPFTTWEKVKEKYDLLGGAMTGILQKYPAIFALTHEEEVGDVSEATPEQARLIVRKAFLEVWQNVENTYSKIESGDLDWRELEPIHEQLKSGQTVSPSGINWSLPFNKWIVDDVVGDYKSHEFWKSLGLSTLAAAAFVIAEIASFGTATFFIAAGVGVVATGIQVGGSWEKYMDLAQASKANVKPELALVSKGQASAALIEAIVNTAFAFIDLYGPAAKGIKGVKGLATKEALEVGEKEVAERTSKEIAEGAEKEAALTIEQNVAGGAESISEEMLIKNKNKFHDLGDHKLYEAGDFCYICSKPPCKRVDIKGKALTEKDIRIMQSERGRELLAERLLRARDAERPYASLGDRIAKSQSEWDEMRNEILAANRKKNGGVLKSDLPEDPNQLLTPPVQSKGGMAQPIDMAAIDHIVPKELGGTSSYHNARVVSQAYNNKLRNLELYPK